MASRDAESTTSSDETTSLLGSSNDATALMASRKLPFLIACSAYIFFNEFSDFVSTAPQTEILEGIICRNYYTATLNGTAPTISPPAMGPGNPCKSEVVQSELAVLNGWIDMCRVLPNILFSLPYGILADRWGRKPVMLLGVVGVLPAQMWTRVVCLFPNIFPVQLVALSGLWGVIGGGYDFSLSIALMMVADIFSEQERASAFFRLYASVFVAQILAAPLSAYLMTINPWVPFTLGLVVQLIGCVIALFLPETLDIAKKKQAMRSGESESAETVPNQEPVKTTSLRGRIRELKRLTGFIWKDLNVLLTIFVMLIGTMNKQSVSLLLQYSSGKFNWSLARANLLTSLQGIFALTNYLATMPLLSTFFTNTLRLPPRLKDLWLTRTSGLLAVLGFLLASLSPFPALFIASMAFFTLGSPFEVAARSLGTSLVAPDHIGTLYSAAAVVQALGRLLACPLFAYLLGIGLKMGGVWLGLPFMVTALFYGAAVSALSFIRLRDENEGAEEEVSLLGHSGV